jgi:ATP-dependent Clp protease ATP-binding subunit ClpA
VVSVFKRFTERARHVVVLAQDEARLLGHNYIGTEHLLLGTLREAEGIGAQALSALSVDIDTMRVLLGEMVGRSESEPSGHLPFTPRAKKVLELSLREALELQDSYIGTEHILLGLMREGEGLAVQMLSRQGVDKQSVREKVIELLAGEAGREPEPEPGPPRTDLHSRLDQLAQRLDRIESLLNRLLNAQNAPSQTQNPVPEIQNPAPERQHPPSQGQTPVPESQQPPSESHRQPLPEQDPAPETPPAEGTGDA